MKAPIASHQKVVESLKKQLNASRAIADNLLLTNHNLEIEIMHYETKINLAIIDGIAEFDVNEMKIDLK